MAKFDIQRIFAELGKLNPEELYGAYQSIKSFVQKVLEAEQKDIEERANELQSKIDRLSGN